MRFRVVAILIPTCGLAKARHLSFADSSSQHQSDVEITWRILKPPGLPGPEAALQVAAGFRTKDFAENAGNPRPLAIRLNDHVYITHLRHQKKLGCQHQRFKD